MTCSNTFAIMYIQDGEPAGLYQEYTTLDEAKLGLDIARKKYPENEYELYEKYQWKQ